MTFFRENCLKKLNNDGADRAFSRDNNLRKYLTYLLLTKRKL